MLKKILIIDDDKEMTGLIAGILSPVFEIRISNTLLEGYSILKNFEADLVLLDINLPDGNGTAYIKRIQEINKNTRIILISAGNESLANTYTSLGAEYFLKKPFDRAALTSAIDKSFQPHHKINNSL